MASPTNMGGSPGTIKPPEAAASSPKATRLLFGPRRPCPVIDTQAVPASTTWSGHIPHCRITRGRLASNTRSAPPISCRSSARAPGSGRPKLRCSLRPFSSSKNPAGPRRAPSGLRVDSTLSTRQPASASSPPASGPAHRLVRSTTTGARPRRGRAGLSHRTDHGRGGAGVEPMAATARPRSDPCSTTSATAMAAIRLWISPQSSTGTASPTKAGTASISEGRGRLSTTQPSDARAMCANPPALLGPLRPKPVKAARCAASSKGSTLTSVPRRRVATAKASPRPRSGRARPAGDSHGGPEAGPVRCIAPDVAQALAHSSSSREAGSIASTSAKVA